MSLTSLLRKAAVYTAVSLSSLVNVPIHSGCQGQGFTLPGSGIYIPDSDEAISVGANEPQPITPQESLEEHQETLYPSKVAFVDLHNPAMISKNSYPGIIIVSSGGINSPGIFSHQMYTLIKFDNLEKFSNKTITSAVLKMNLYNSSNFQEVPAQSPEFKSRILYTIDSWSENTLSWNFLLTAPNGGWNADIILPNYFTHTQNFPSSEKQWDLTSLKIRNTNDSLLEYWADHPNQNHGLVISPVTDLDPSNYEYRNNHLTGNKNSIKMDVKYQLLVTH